MCGIGGIYNLNQKSVDAGVLERMTKIIRHRGPDDEGFLLVNTANGNVKHCAGTDTIDAIKSTTPQLNNDIEANLALGFRRLAIIDLSPLGHQPMCNSNGDVWIVFNGEIYNYIELREELKSLGYNFKTGSDTEVIVNAYQHWGVDCLNRFNGMWSFALWDKRKKRLFCARDRFGVKPFFYYFDNQSFIFGSEIKQILEHPIDKSLNYDVIYKNFGIGSFTINSDCSYFKNIKILPHSHYLLIESGELKISRYYDLPVEKFESSKLSFAEACEQYKELFSDAVRLRMRSDVEVGSTLSGGLDSSAIVSVACKYTDKQFKTFSSYYTYQPQYDERKWINLVVERTSSKAFYVSATPQQVMDDIQKIVWFHDYPIETSSPIAQYYVMKLARENGVTVLLDGQGSDELTGGYNHAFYRYYSDLISRFKWMRFVQEYPSYLKHNQKGSVVDKFVKTAASFFLNEQKLYAAEMKYSFNPVIKPNSDIYPYEVKNIKASRLSTFLYNEMMSNSIQTLLHYEDRNSMAHSIESRVPFLDYRFVEFVFSLPSTYKIQGNFGKHIHREALKTIVPKEITERKDKIGFLSPGENIWMRNELKPFADDIFNSSSFRNREFLDQKIIQQEYLKYKNGDQKHAKKLWHLLTLELWIRQNKVNI